MNTGSTRNYRKYSYKIPLRKLILSQFGAAMLGIMTSMPTISISSGHTLDIITSSLAVAFLLYLQYTAIWDIAAKDKIAIDGGRLREDKLFGLKAALFANIPTYALAVISIALRGIYLLTHADWVGAISTATYGAELLWNFMYHGYLSLLIPGQPDSPIFLAYLASFILITVPSLITCLIAYNQGLKGKRILPEKKKD
ncbi:MAG: hypothetical protein E7647_00350 [Ruminococcaceae bacterium]|nr:hypothetical protein [Oscillospiraceae bacterium]